MGFLYFGFLRSCLGTMALPAGTCPTRSRASLRISLSISNFRLRATRYLPVYFVRQSRPDQGIIHDAEEPDADRRAARLRLGNGSAATRGAGEPDARLYRRAGAT